MMRSTFQPLALLVDAAAEKWLAAESASGSERQIVEQDIVARFQPGDHEEMTFHGQKYLLTIRKQQTTTSAAQRLSVAVHEIATAG